MAKNKSAKTNKILKAKSGLGRREGHFGIATSPRNITGEPTITQKLFHGNPQGAQKDGVRQDRAPLFGSTGVCAGGNRLQLGDRHQALPLPMSLLSCPLAPGALVAWGRKLLVSVE